jgi:hypothetical protein
MKYELQRDVALVDLTTHRRIPKQVIRVEAETKRQAREIIKRFLGVLRLRGKIRRKPIAEET